MTFVVVSLMVVIGIGLLYSTGILKKVFDKINNRKEE